uniref:4-hydroxy-tetrahydrodipicolinate synthase n=1 Tax=Alexandrium andersonii TaxID=327968 RepID=A0A7S2DY17_9DINO|mmetsp:Transcript_6164/g.14030  ORF Transcript_6164/g.14030 Transcript_6164/m.14030 type:complete len:330 (+) Transcript_6164:57-1046(+)
MPADGPAAKQAKTMPTSPAALKLRQLRLMTAIKTPYKPDGDIDLEAFDKHVEHQIKHGVEALIIGGTTGEGHLFSWDEHLSLIAHTKSKFGGRIAIVGNTGSNHTAETAYATKKGFALGMDCALLINPYYGKTSARGIVMHIEAGLKYGPGIIYNVPGRTGQDIKPEVIMELSKNENFVGVKECMGHERIKLLSDQGVACWSGNDEQCHLSRREHGAVGVISVTSNIVPGLMRELMHGERNDALDAKLQPLYKWLFTEPNPIGVNTMLMMMGAAHPVFRLPYTHTSKEMREEAMGMMKSIGLEHCPVFREKGMIVLEDSDFKHTLGGDE